MNETTEFKLASVWKCVLVILLVQIAHTPKTSLADDPPGSVIANCIGAATLVKLQISELLVSGNEAELSGLAGPVDHSSSDDCSLDVRGQDIEIRPKKEPLIGTKIRLESKYDAEAKLVEWRCVGQGIPVAVLPPRCESEG